VALFYDCDVISYTYFKAWRQRSPAWWPHSFESTHLSQLNIKSCPFFSWFIAVHHKRAFRSARWHKRNFMSNLSRLLLSLILFIFFFLQQSGGKKFISLVIWQRHIFCFLQPLYHHFFLVIKNPMAQTNDYVVRRKVRRSVSNRNHCTSRLFPKYDGRYLKVVLVQALKEYAKVVLQLFPYLISALDGLGHLHASLLYLQGKSPGTN
jgi:hypothetical protein